MRCTRQRNKKGVACDVYGEDRCRRLVGEETCGKESTWNSTWEGMDWVNLA
jgi:hypothetical protein